MSYESHQHHHEHHRHRHDPHDPIESVASSRRSFVTQAASGQEQVPAAAELAERYRRMRLRQIMRRH